MKKHNLLKVTLLTLLLVIIGSWFLPVTSITNGEFTTVESTKIGLFTLTSYIEILFRIFSPIIVYILAVGGLYGVLHRIPQYRLLLDKIVKGFKGKEWLFMSIVGIVFAFLSSMAEFSVPLILLFPFVISVILLMGYDKITAAMLTVGSTVAGLIGTVFSLNQNYGIEQVLELGANTNVAWKIGLLVISLALVLVNTIIYGRKHRNYENYEREHLVPKKVVTNNKRIYPLVIVLDLLLVVLVLAYISWSLLEVNLFTDMTNAFVNPTGGEFIKGLYGGINTFLGVTEEFVFGSWTLFQAALIIFLASGLIAFLYRKSFNKFISATEEGAKKAMRPALLTVIAYMILICIVTVPFEMTILQNILSLDSGFQFLPMIIVAIFYSLFTVESYYGITSAASYVLAVSSAEKVGIISLIWQSMYGLVMLVAPTSVILLVTLSYMDVSYTNWLKAIWKLLLELFIAILVLLLIFNM